MNRNVVKSLDLSSESSCSGSAGLLRRFEPHPRNRACLVDELLFKVNGRLAVYHSCLQAASSGIYSFPSDNESV